MISRVSSAILMTILCSLCAGAAEWSAPRDVEFTAKIDGTAQHFVELLPEDFKAGDPHHLVIAFHGHGSDRWQYVKDERGECKGARDIALKYNMIFVSPDYRAKTSWMGPMAEADVVQIIGELRTKYKIGKVFLVGASMGGSSVLAFTALHPELVDGVCSQNAMANFVEYTGFQDAFVASYGGDKKEKPDEYKKRSAEFFPEKFTMPVAFTTSGKDAVVPPQSVLRLFEAIKKNNPQSNLIHREDAGHATDYKDTTKALEFVIQTVLKHNEPAKQ